MSKLLPDTIAALRLALQDDPSHARAAHIVETVLTKAFTSITNRPRRSVVPVHLQQLYYFVNADGNIDLDIWLYCIDVTSPPERVRSLLLSHLARRFKSQHVWSINMCVSAVSQMKEHDLVLTQNAHLAAELRALPDFPRLLIPEVAFFAFHLLGRRWENEDVVAFLSACRGGVPPLISARLDSYRLTVAITDTQLQSLIRHNWDVARAFPRALPEFVHALGQFLKTTHKGTFQYVLKESMRGVSPEKVAWVQAETVARYLPVMDCAALRKHLTLLGSDSFRTEASIRQAVRHVLPYAPAILANGLAEAICVCSEVVGEGVYNVERFTHELQFERPAMSLELCPLYYALLAALLTPSEMMALEQSLVDVTNPLTLRQALWKTFYGAPTEMLSELQWILGACMAIENSPLTKGVMYDPAPLLQIFVSARRNREEESGKSQPRQEEKQQDDDNQRENQSRSTSRN